MHRPASLELLERERRGADHAGVGSERSGDELDLVLRREGPGVELGTGRLQQQLAGIHDTAADHDQVRVEGIRKAGERGPESAADVVEGLDRGFVPGPRGRRQGEPVERLAVGEQAAQLRVRMGGGGERRLTGQRRSRGVTLDTAVARAGSVAAGTVIDENHVAELGTGSVRAAVEVAVDDQAATDPGSEGEQNDVGGAAGGAVTVLGERGEVGVVVHRDRKADPLRDDVSERHVGERQVDGIDADAAAAIDRAGNPEPDRGDAGTGRDRRAQLALEQVEDLRLALAVRGGDVAMKQLHAASEDPDEHLRAPEVDADGLRRAQCEPTPAAAPEAWIREAIRQYYPLMATGDDDRPDRPDYNVYRGGRSRSGGRSKRSPAPKQDAPEQSSAAERSAARSSGAPAKPTGDGDPDYRVYRSSRSPFSKLKGAGGGVREKLRGSDSGGPGDTGKPLREPGEKPTWRKVLRWTLIVAGAWILLSVVLFVVSAQIQKGKLNDDAAAKLGGNPLMAVFPQTILVMGTDARPEGTDEPGAESKKRCIEGAAVGDPPANDCLPFRADTLMVVRAGGGAFEKLSIPRDTFAAIPGHDSQKINAAYAFGGAALQIETVENFLGIDIDHAVIVDFAGFQDLIDAVGGVEIQVPEKGGFKSKVGGGAGQGGITLELDRGQHTLDGQDALVYARTRKNLKDESENDLDRARRQQQVLSGLKSRLTSPWRLPYNFFHGPFIAWNAPKAMVSDMGGLTLPQLAFAAAIGGKPSDTILGKKGATPTVSGDIAIPVSECEKAVKKLLGEAGPRTPECSPGF